MSKTLLKHYLASVIQVGGELLVIVCAAATVGWHPVSIKMRVLCCSWLLTEYLGTLMKVALQAGSCVPGAVKHMPA